MSSDGECQTPILDLLRGVPIDARMTYEVSPTHHHMIPVGRMCAQAAEEIVRVRDLLYVAPQDAVEVSLTPDGGMNITVRRNPCAS
jgi:hypothetical protein